MPIAALKYTVQYSTLVETWANVFLAILVKLAAQYFFCLHFTLKMFLKSAEGVVNTTKLNLQILRKYNNRFVYFGKLWNV